MKKTMIAIAFAVASVPMMFAAQANPPANPPVNSGTKTEAPKVKKHSKKAVKKAPKKDAGSTGSAASK
ncbi:MAG TPA: hypothetical protein VKX45_26380 [Bryobacteraceae bacterium]|jgi:hypothetical protein|nr:hypothetical protein [Bryobacteraceae bacterium]